MRVARGVVDAPAVAVIAADVRLAVAGVRSAEDIRLAMDVCVAAASCLAVLVTIASPVIAELIAASAGGLADMRSLVLIVVIIVVFIFIVVVIATALLLLPLSRIV